jgi:hypothetical protein
MDNETAKQGETREPYEPPAIEDVPIHAEEQLLSGCKQTAGPGARATPCRNCKFPSSS